MAENNYIDKIKKNGVEYEIHDPRVDEKPVEDNMLLLDLTDNEPENYGHTFHLTEEQKAYFLSICELHQSGVVILKEEPKYDFVKIKLPQYDNGDTIIGFYYLVMSLTAAYAYYLDENGVGFSGIATCYDYAWYMNVIVYPTDGSLYVDGFVSSQS